MMDAVGDRQTTAVGLASTTCCDSELACASMSSQRPQNSFHDYSEVIEGTEETVTTFRGAIRGAIRGAASATLSNLEESSVSAAESAARFRCACQAELTLPTPPCCHPYAHYANTGRQCHRTLLNWLQLTTSKAHHIPKSTAMMDCIHFAVHLT